MKKILIGVVAAIVITTGGFFGFEFYVQRRAASEVEAAFAQIRATGSKASHGKVSFDLLSRTITVADIASESATQPSVRVKIANFTALGVSQPDPTRFSADTIEATGIEVEASMGVQAGLRFTYKAPQIAIKDFSGPAGAQRPLASPSAVDVYRFALEHFAAVTASSITAPSVAATVSMPGASGAQVVDYTYSNVALRDIKDGRIAATTVDRASFTANIQQGGKTETIGGEFAGMAAYDFDSTAMLAMLDPARANDDKYYRAHRQITVGAYTAAFPNGVRMRMDGMTVDDVGLRPSKLQFPRFMAMIESAPPPGTTPTPAQTRDMLEKMAGLYEGLHVGNAEIRGLTIETPGGPLKLAAIRFNLENGKIGEFAIEGLDARSPKGPIKVGRFALKSLDIASLLRMSSQFSDPSQKPSPDQLVGLFLLLEGAEIKGVVAPYKDSTTPVNVETLDLNWGQFVGPIPSKVRLTAKMTGPLDASDPETFKMLVASGMHSAAINLDLGAAWAEGPHTFVLDPVMVELGGVLTASARLSLGNVPREMFSINPLQAAMMAAQIEAGTIELSLRDTGGVDLAVAQYARTQNVSRAAARQAIMENIKAASEKIVGGNPDAVAAVEALVRFVETPRQTLTLKLVPLGKVPALQLMQAFNTDPLLALAQFQIEASTGL
jgi:hypothetical protein